MELCEIVPEPASKESAPQSLGSLAAQPAALAAFVESYAPSTQT
jgi:hypothetical protein